MLGIPRPDFPDPPSAAPSAEPTEPEASSPPGAEREAPSKSATPSHRTRARVRYDSANEALPVIHRRKKALRGLAVLVLLDFSDLRLHAPEDKFSRDFEPAVEVERGDQRLEKIGEDRYWKRFLVRHSFPDGEILFQPRLGYLLRQNGRGYHYRFYLCKFTLGRKRVAFEKVLRNDRAQYGVA